MWLQLLAVLITSGVGWLTWHAYGVYRTGQLLSAMPGPPRRPGMFNMLMGNLGDLAGTTQNHFLQTRWARQYGPMTKLRLFTSYVSYQV